MSSVSTAVDQILKSVSVVHEKKEYLLDKMIDVESEFNIAPILWEGCYIPNGIYYRYENTEHNYQEQIFLILYKTFFSSNFD